MAALLLSEQAIVSEQTMRGLRDKLGLGDISVTQLSKALRSLHYKYGQVNLYRDAQFRWNVVARSGIGCEALVRRALADGVRYANSDEDLARHITGCDPTRSSLYKSVLDWLQRLIKVNDVTVSVESDELNADPRFPTKQVRAYRLA